jgi:hypothetical protein
VTPSPSIGQGPVFIVGLPRSGSTLLSRWVNESDDVVVFNDLYYVQAVLSAGATGGPLDGAALASLADRLLTVLRRYSSDGARLAARLQLSPAQIQAIEEEVTARHRSSPLDWAGLMDETLRRAASAVGKARWADKTPQNFLHLDLLRGAFPSARFLYLVRDPRNVLASYKHAHGPGHDRRRYHPVPYALYWRAMARSCLAERDSRSDVAVVRYEDLLQRPEAAAGALGSFLATTVPSIDTGQVGTNSSFRDGPVGGLSESERWVCERLCSPEMAALGYDGRPSRPRLADAPDLLAVTARFATFQLRRATTSPDARRRIAAVSSRALRR